MNSSALGVGIDLGERALHALRLAGGARRVVHRRARRPVLGHRRRLRGRRARRTTGSPGSPRAPAGSRRGMPASSAAALASVGEALVADEHLGVGVLEDVRDLGRRQPVVDRHVVQAGLQRREVHVHRVSTRSGSTAATVSPLSIPRLRSACTTWLARASTSPASVLGAVGIDDREVARILFGVLPEAGHAVHLSSGAGAESRTRSILEARRAAAAHHPASVDQRTETRTDRRRYEWGALTRVFRD